MRDRLYRDRMSEWQQGHPYRYTEPGTRGGVSADGGSPIAGLYQLVPQEETEAPEVSENGQVPELELAET